MARNDNFFNRLTRLFRSGPAIQRKVKGYNYNNYFDNDIIRGNYGYRAPFPFGRESSPFSVLGAYGLLDRTSRYAEFSEMEYCLVGDTKIAVPGGYKTIKELADEYGLEKEFIVYSYDHNKKQIVPAIGKQARQTRVDDAYRVVFDSGKEIIGTANHRLLKRDGTYCEIRDLKPGDAMMPFYRKDLFSDAKSDEGEGYRWIYTMDKEGSTIKNGWTSEHQLIASWIAGRALEPNEVVHHSNFIKHDNRPENLQIMTESEHASYHSTLNNEKKWNSNNQEWINEFKKRHSDWMIKNNPAERKDITFDRILNWCLDNSFNIYRVCKAFDTDPDVIRRKLRAKGFETFVMFAQAYKPGWKSDSWNNRGNKNPRFNSEINFDRICSTFEKGISQKDIAERLGCSITPITNRLKEQGYKSWTDFANTYENHKVVSVDYYGTIPLYDLTVDGYKNFATDSVISHNTPEIAAALNIYADECTTGDERGKTFHILSSNPQIKKALDELFYDILNVEFNLRPWVRNLVKYGDFFLYNEVIPDIGVVNVQPIRVNELEREEGWDPNDPYAVRFKWLTRGNRYLENWQVTHMRILGNDMFLPYGSSVLEPARRIWRQLIMMEDSMLVYRVVRSPERRVFYIDVGNIAPNDIPTYMEQAKQTLRARDVVSRTDGRVDQRYNPLPVHKDTPIPLLDGRTITIENLSKEYESGKENWVYSIQDQTQQIVPGKVIWCGKNYTAKKLIKVWLDDDTYVTTAPEHPFILRDGSSKRADELIVGQALMPFYSKFSTKEDGMLIEGYPMVYDPSVEKYKFTHRIVANSILHEERENVRKNTDWKINNNLTVHHKDCNRLNSYPDNLQWIGNVEHVSLHAKMGTERLIEYNKSIKKRLKTIEDNKKYNKGKKLAQSYNGTELHKQHNEIRMKAQKESWKKDSASRKMAMRWNIPDLFWNELARLVKENPTFGRQKIHNLLMQNELITQALKEIQNTERTIDKFSFAAWEGELVRKGFAKLAGYRNAILAEQNTGYKNHKVKNIEVLEVPGEDVYCMTVVGPDNENDRHNFAIKSLDKNSFMCHNGVFLKNSVDDDYFIPVRGGQTGTKIETLAGGQNATATEDVEYLQKKLFAAIQVPKPYLNFTEGMSAKASLAQQDVRFSRTITALQKIAIAELNKLAMIHLYAKGFNEEDLTSFNLKLANPSTIALLQKLENMASKFDIAAKAKETKLVDELWIQKNIIELSDDELMNIERGRREDKIREVEIESIAVSANPDPGPARIVSPFDNSNYKIPGEDVSRSKPSEDDDFFQKMDDYSQIQDYKENSGGDTFKLPNVDGTSPPIQATPFIKRSEKNRLRRVGAGGKSNLEMPDFGAMFDRKNVSLTDIYDKKFLDNPLMEQMLEEELGLYENVHMPKDFYKTLDQLKLFLEQNRTKSKLIKEENEQIEIKMNNDELLIESVDGGDESSDGDKKVDISEIDLSRLD